MKIGTMTAQTVTGKNIALKNFGVERIEEKDATQYITILDTKIEYNFFEDGYEKVPMDEIDIQHVEKLLSEGYREGELNHGEEEVRGYWKKAK